MIARNPRAFVSHHGTTLRHAYYAVGEPLAAPRTATLAPDVPEGWTARPAGSVDVPPGMLAVLLVVHPEDARALGFDVMGEERTP